LRERRHSDTLKIERTRVDRQNEREDVSNPKEISNSIIAARSIPHKNMERQLYFIEDTEAFRLVTALDIQLFFLHTEIIESEQGYE